MHFVNLPFYSLVPKIYTALQNILLITSSSGEVGLWWCSTQWFQSYLKTRQFCRPEVPSSQKHCFRCTQQNKRAHCQSWRARLKACITKLRMEEASSSVSDDQKNAAAAGRNADPCEQEKQKVTLDTKIFQKWQTWRFLSPIGVAERSTEGKIHSDHCVGNVLNGLSRFSGKRSIKIISLTPSAASKNK